VTPDNPNPWMQKKKGQAAAAVLCRERCFQVGDVLISRTWRMPRELVRVGARTIELKEVARVRALRSTLEWLPTDVQKQEVQHAT